MSISISGTDTTVSGIKRRMLKNYKSIASRRTKRRKVIAICDELEAQMRDLKEKIEIAHRENKVINDLCEQDDAKLHELKLDHEFAEKEAERKDKINANIKQLRLWSKTYKYSVREIADLEKRILAGNTIKDAVRAVFPDIHDTRRGVFGEMLDGLSSMSISDAQQPRLSQPRQPMNTT